MRRFTEGASIVALVLLITLGAGTEICLAGHALDSPIQTTNPGDFFVSGNADFDGTSVCDGIWTFNAAPVFVVGVGIGGDLDVTGDVGVTGNLVVTGTTTVTDTLIILGPVRGGQVFFSFTDATNNITADAFLDYGSMTCSALRGATMPSGGHLHAYSMRINVDAAGGTASTVEVDINGVLAFSDTLATDVGTGWYTSEKTFAHGTHPFVAGDFISAEWNETGVWQVDAPQMGLIAHLSE